MACLSIGVHTVDFRKATDSLFDRVSHEDLAEQLGLSVASIRQARLDSKANSHRNPPKGWEKAIIGLAEERTKHFNELICALTDPERHQ